MQCCLRSNQQLVERKKDLTKGVNIGCNVLQICGLKSAFRVLIDDTDTKQ